MWKCNRKVAVGQQQTADRKNAGHNDEGQRQEEHTVRGSRRPQ
jgi:hypothetical protein